MNEHEVKKIDVNDIARLNTFLKLVRMYMHDTEIEHLFEDGVLNPESGFNGTLSHTLFTLTQETSITADNVEAVNSFWAIHDTLMEASSFFAGNPGAFPTGWELERERLAS